MKSEYFLQTTIAALGLTVLHFLMELVFGLKMDGSTLLWHLLANLLIVSVLGAYVIHSGYSSKKLVLATFAIFYVIGNFNLVIEAFIFEVIDGAVMIKSVLFGIPYTMAGSFLVIWVFKRWNTEARPLQTFVPRRRSIWSGKILLANFLYVIFYLIAGNLVEMLTPGFTEFYQGKLPSMVTFFMTNMFFRGFVFVAIAILIDRSINAHKWTKALLVGLVFSIVGGIAPLIPPSEEMPQFIRVAHAYEVGISNFLYGICILLIVRSKE